MPPLDMIEIQTVDGPAEAHLARNDGDPGPGVLMFMDALGVRPTLESMADTVTSWGYTVLLPNVFHRSGTAAEVSPDGPLMSDEARAGFFEVARPRIAALAPHLSGADTTRWIEALDDAVGHTGPIGVVGFCMGARLAIRAACDHPDRVVACAGYHGGGLATEDPQSPHLGLPHATAEFVFGHADGDASMDAEAIARLDAALAAAGLTAESAVYTGARHGYTMADTNVFNPEGFARYESTFRALLDRTLGSGNDSA